MATPKTETAFFVGRRFNTKMQLCYFWQFEGEEKLRGYKKQLAAAKIGEQWTFKLDEQGRILTGWGPNRPIQTGEFAPQKQTVEWEGVSAAHEQSFQDKKLEEKLKKRKSEFEHALVPLREMANSLTHGERAAFINKVVTELWRHKSS